MVFAFVMDMDKEGMISIRTLVVEDSEPFRRYVTSMLQQRPELSVLGEVEDGLTAVRMATDLKPELILLDVGLPELNGMDAARRIRKAVPESKILFLSQESSPEVVEEAVALGARGYVSKSTPEKIAGGYRCGSRRKSVF
jgi:DNA-binding NarL/FixJ family response regulator